MTPAYAAFTERGLRLAEKLATSLPGSVTRCGHGGPALAQWTAAEFVRSDALVFVGAVGIAVRAIAPHCQSKAQDPAVVVLDECGRFAVPILSGHLGGANDLARALAAVCGAVPVITTATDANGVFAVDEWAKHQNCTVLMVTHNMHQALELGNRTLMMDAGRIVFDVKGEERRKMTVDDLLEKFRENAGKALDNDRILLSKVEKNN